MEICTVCKNNNVIFYAEIKKMLYWECQVCEAKLLDSKNFITFDAEKKHYLKHNNNIDDSAYRNFLLRLVNPIKDKISNQDLGLDYGCGYAPALAHILIQDGFKIQLYDPIFFPDNSIFLRKFNFITCSEAVEHFFNPYEEFKKIDSILLKNSFLAVMTSFMDKRNSFEKWHYRRDPTHVVFYTQKTFEIIAYQRNWLTDYPEKDIVILKKQ